MAEIIRMPRMSDTMEEGLIVEWHKKEGDKVKPGDVLADVETDKATMELESYQEGVLLYIGVKAGETVPVNGVLAVVGEKGEDYKELLKNEEDSAEKDGEKGEKKAEKKEDIKDEERDDEKKSSAKKEGGDEKEVEDEEGEEDDEDVKSTSKKERKEETSEDKQEEGRLRISPLARRLAKESNIDISSLKGSGDEGRIVRKDVESYIEDGGAPAKGDGKAASTAVPGKESYKEVAVSQMRKTIARRLAESKYSAPHFYLTIEVDMDNVVAAREQINAIAESKISFNDIIIRSVAAALRKHPAVNASWLGDKIRYSEHIHIGMAVAVDEGLVVPVIRFADTKSLTQISQESKSYGERARKKQLQLDEFKGNTFTVSNLGMFGIEEFTAIINPPDACILAIGAIKQKPVVKNGEIKIGNRMKLTMSCDHRVVDGATGSKFLQTLQQFLEQPLGMML